MILKKECYNDERAIKKGNSLMLKKVIKEAFPTVLAFTMSGMYSIVDGIFVGKAAGDTGLAAINIAWPIPALITALGIGIGTGGSVLYSHYRGRGEQKVCENLFELTMTLLIGTGILATILLSLVQKPFLEILGAAGSVQTEAIKYTAIIIAGSILQVVGTGIMPLLRNMNQSLGAMLSMAAGFAVNILVNYYLMFRLNMGIKGAAFGTVTAQAVVVMAGCAILWKTGYRKWRPLWHGQYAADIFKIGITAFGTSLAPTAALIFTNLQCLRYGGNAAVACYAVISYIVFPVQYFLTGIGEGVQPLISFLSWCEKGDGGKSSKKNRLHRRNYFWNHGGSSYDLYDSVYWRMVWSVSRVKAVLFFGDADQFICISVNGNGKVECILSQCSHADEKSGVHDLYRKPGSFANLFVFASGCLGYQRNLAGAPGNGRHYDRDLRVDKKG